MPDLWKETVFEEPHLDSVYSSFNLQRKMSELPNNPIQ